MKQVWRVGLIVFGILVVVVCGVVMTFSLIGRQVTDAMMFATLAGLIVLFGASIHYKLAIS